LIDAWDSTQARNWFSAVFMPVNVAPR
jgi:hypothetical protein